VLKSICFIHFLSSLTNSSFNGVTCQMLNFESESQMRGSDELCVREYSIGMICVPGSVDRI
jgi:hypothetical protein